MCLPTVSSCRLVAVATSPPPEIATPKTSHCAQPHKGKAHCLNDIVLTYMLYVFFLSSSRILEACYFYFFFPSCLMMSHNVSFLRSGRHSPEQCGIEPSKAITSFGPFTSTVPRAFSTQWARSLRTYVFHIVERLIGFLLTILLRLDWPTPSQCHLGLLGLSRDLPACGCPSSLTEQVIKHR